MLQEIINNEKLVVEILLDKKNSATYLLLCYKFWLILGKS